MTKIDVLGGIDKLKICTHYELGAKSIHTIPADLETLQGCEPKYATLGGWDEIEPKKMEKILAKGVSELPPNMKKYVKFIEHKMGVPVVLLGLGRRRNEILDLRKSKWRRGK